MSNSNSASLHFCIDSSWCGFRGPKLQQVCAVRVADCGMCRWVRPIPAKHVEKLMQYIYIYIYIYIYSVIFMWNSFYGVFKYHFRTHDNEHRRNKPAPGQPGQVVPPSLEVNVPGLVGKLRMHWHETIFDLYTSTLSIYHSRYISWRSWIQFWPLLQCVQISWSKGLIIWSWCVVG